MNALAPLLPAAPTLFSVGSMPNQLELLFARVLKAKVVGSTYNPADTRDKFTAVYAQRGGWRYEMDVYLRDLTRDPLPVEARSCDGVLCFEVVEHLRDSPLPLFRDVHRALKQDGYLLLSTPNMQHWHRVLYLLNGMTYPDLDFQEPIESRHTHIFSFRELRDLLRVAGLEVVARFFADPWENARHMAQFDRQHPLNAKILEVLADGDEFQHECVFLAARPIEGLPVLTTGWHPVEWQGADWLRWNAGRAELRIVARSTREALLRGALYSIQQPNRLDIIVNGNLGTSLDIDWDSFRSFPPIRLELTEGENVIAFVSRNSAITLPTDNRLLAVAVKNLSLTMGNAELRVLPSSGAS